MAHSGKILISVFQAFSGSINKGFIWDFGGRGGGWVLDYHSMEFRQFRKVLSCSATREETRTYHVMTPVEVWKRHLWYVNMYFKD